MSKNIIILTALACLAIVVSCGDSQSEQPTQEETLSLTVKGWTAELVPSSQALSPGAEEFTVELSDANGPVEPSTLEVEAWMPAHGHGTMKPSEIENVAAGVYEVVVTFSMPGHWELRVDADDRSFVFDVEVLP